MASNPYTNKVVYGGNTLIDISGDTLVSADQLLKDIVAHCKDGSTITGTLEAGGASGISFDVYTPATTGYDHTIEHGLGTIPKIFVICCGTFSAESSKTRMLDSAHGFSDRNLVYRLSRSDGSYSPSGYIATHVSITQTLFSKNTALANANRDNISVGGNYQLFAGFEYYWFALA